MTINLNLVPQSKYQLKCPYSMDPVGICVHNTANDASAKGEIAYMVGNDKATSFHLAVDDIEVWQGLPLDRNGFHAGDGANGAGNRKHIGIEICYSKSGGEKFTKAEDNAAQLIVEMLKARNWGIERVKKHQDFSGKYCPHRTLDLGWDRFIANIKSKMEGVPTMNELVKFLGISDEKAIIDTLSEHLGIRDGKCQWGAEPAEGQPNFGGHLGSARAEVTRLKKQLSQPSQPISNAVEPGFKKVQNGLTETFEKDGVTYTKNYTVVREI